MYNIASATRKGQMHSASLMLESSAIKNKSSKASFFLSITNEITRKRYRYSVHHQIKRASIRILDPNRRQRWPQFRKLRNTPGVTGSNRSSSGNGGVGFDIRGFWLTALRCCRTRWRTLLFLFSNVLAATGRGDSSFVRLLRFRLGFFFFAQRRCLFLVHLFLGLNILLLRPASLPAVLPVADQKIEAICLNLHARLKAYTEIAVIHFILINVGM